MQSKGGRATSRARGKEHNTRLDGRCEPSGRVHANEDVQRGSLTAVGGGPRRGAAAERRSGGGVSPPIEPVLIGPAPWQPSSKQTLPTPSTVHRRHTSPPHAMPARSRLSGPLLAAALLAFLMLAGGAQAAGRALQVRGFAFLCFHTFDRNGLADTDAYRAAWGLCIGLWVARKGGRQ